jgi:hypothetical protein
MPPDKEKTPAACTGASPEISTTDQGADDLILLADLAGVATVVVAFDWRAAARATEHADQLQPIDHALTATGLAAELHELAGRIGGAS